MSGKVREYFDFAINEPDSTGDMFEILKDLSAEELREVEKISGNTLNAVLSLKACKIIIGEKSEMK